MNRFILALLIGAILALIAYNLFHTPCPPAHQIIAQWEKDNEDYKAGKISFDELSYRSDRLIKCSEKIREALEERTGQDRLAGMPELQTSLSYRDEISFHRRAGACPPRSLNPTKPIDVFCDMQARRGTGPRPTVAGEFWHGEGNPLACACGMRGPKPYGSTARFG